MKTNRKCPACGAETAEVIYKNKMRIPEGVHLPNSYDIVSCDTCGNCFADTQASGEDYDEYYDNHNYYGGGWAYNSSSKSDYRVIENILKRIVSKDSTIVDVGCGNGGFLKFMRENWQNLTGIDPSEESVKGLEEVGIRGLVGSIYDNPEDDKRYDVVIFTMVLEHLLNPQNALTSIRDNYLKKGGYVIVTWPYFEDLMVDCSPILNNFNHEHINYYSDNTAEILFNRCGYSKVEHHISLGLVVNDFVSFSNIACYKLVEEKIHRIIEKDEKTKNSIVEYIKRMSIKERKSIETINNLAQRGEEMVIWGTGSYLMHMMEVSKLSECNIQYIVDNNALKQGKKLFDYDILPPERLRDFCGTVLVTSMLYGENIKKQILDMGNNECEIVLV